MQLLRHVIVDRECGSKARGTLGGDVKGVFEGQASLGYGAFVE